MSKIQNRKAGWVFLVDLFRIQLQYRKGDLYLIHICCIWRIGQPLKGGESSVEKEPLGHKIFQKLWLSFLNRGVQIFEILNSLKSNSRIFDSKQVQPYKLFKYSKFPNNSLPRILAASDNSPFWTILCLGWFTDSKNLLTRMIQKYKIASKFTVIKNTIHCSVV